MKFPKIGLRMVKTAVAVFFCLLIEIILRWMLTDEISLTYYSPFFAGLATVYALNNRRENSIMLAKMRVFGSVIGGVFGAIFLYSAYGLVSRFGLAEHGLIYDSIIYVLIALGTLLLIYLLVHLKWQHMVFIAVLTFLAVAVGNRSELPYYIYAINRVSSTVIGVVISIVVNLFSIHLYKQKKLTVITSIDGVLLRQDNVLNNHQRFNLDMLLGDQLDLYINTSRSPASLIPLFHDLEMNHQMVVMDGSAIYDPQLAAFSEVIYMPYDATTKIHQLLDHYGLNYFSHTVIDHRLQIYYKALKHAGDLTFYHTRRNEYFRHFAKGEIPAGERVCYDMVIVKSDMVIQLTEALRNMSLPIKVSSFIFNEQDIEGYHLIRITSIDTDKQKMFEHIKKHKSHEVVVAFGHRESDMSYYQKAQVRICFDDADQIIKNQATLILKSDANDTVIHIIKKLYYQKGYLHKLNSNQK